MPASPSIPGKAGGAAGAGSSDPDSFKSTDDKDLKASGNSIGIVMRVDRPEDAKPVYINMSPMYDFRNYILWLIKIELYKLTYNKINKIIK